MVRTEIDCIAGLDAHSNFQRLEGADGESAEEEDSKENDYHCCGFDDGLVFVSIGKTLCADVGHGATEAGEPHPEGGTEEERKRG